MTAHQFSMLMPLFGEGGALGAVPALHRGDGDDHRRRVGGRRNVVWVLLLRLGGLRGAVALDLRLGVLQLLRVGLGAAADVLLDGDALEVGVGGEGDLLLREVVRPRARLDQQVHADRALQGHRGLGQRDRVDGAAVGGDVSGAQTELVGELHQGVRDRGVALFGLHARQLGGVGGRTQRRQLGLRVPEQLQPALQTGLRRHVLRGLVEGGGGVVGELAGPGDRRVVPLAGEQGRGRDVALLVDGVAVAQ
ncbi:hypothetical protein QFZ66_002838 [Streptomyces sp. B4I13]|nr:hypothetical protein [Streptomyces sp. B4I13]